MDGLPVFSPLCVCLCVCVCMCVCVCVCVLCQLKASKRMLFNWEMELNVRKEATTWITFLR